MSEATLELSIAADHPAYAGHFPGQPILPGVVLLDAALHSLAAVAGAATGCSQVKSVKFLSSVLPGEALTLHYSAAPGGGFRFDIRAHARAVASGVIEFTEGAAA
ncbi:MAG: hypothetical protein IV085_05140 [Thiobacillus sp.]|nr:hypothetical protein [Thiobacillus sp.]